MSPNSVMPLWQGLIIIAIAGAVTQFTRWLPFIALARRQLPDRIVYLGGVLPYAMMPLLVVYCLRAVPAETAALHGLPELTCALLTALLHYRWGNMLISIAGGTLLYMGLRQVLIIKGIA
ncbi:MAG: AzlD domain-containing protein [Clostridiales bacterium]|nr:AzlD domain-containing protein [Clostridiales bacterium]MDU2292902.1 AzlD domain-containing protein [Peptococcus niger]MDU5952049.1 AzlD domain-containing protein [Clostridiales bacterium]MDU7244677.1 AzlD domain-containing protein [Clostridiales bacterium]MDU7504813.1 AzlD domain-containing protein [Clostridia bacterium]